MIQRYTLYLIRTNISNIKTNIKVMGEFFNSPQSVVFKEENFGQEEACS